MLLRVYFKCRTWIFLSTKIMSSLALSSSMSSKNLRVKGRVKSEFRRMGGGENLAGKDGQVAVGIDQHNVIDAQILKVGFDGAAALKQRHAGVRTGGAGAVDADVGVAREIETAGERDAREELLPLGNRLLGGAVFGNGAGNQAHEVGVTIGESRPTIVHEPVD